MRGSSAVSRRTARRERHADRRVELVDRAVGRAPAGNPWRPAGRRRGRSSPRRRSSCRSWSGAACGHCPAAAGGPSPCRGPRSRASCYHPPVIDGRHHVTTSCSEERVPLAREEKQEIITGFATKEGDTGSPEVQVALLTERIKELTGASPELPQGQSFAPRPPQARRPAPPPSRLPDEEGQRALPGRHRTARTPPLGVAASGPRAQTGVLSHPAPKAQSADLPAGRRPPPRPRRNHSLVSDLRDAIRWPHADHRDRQARTPRRRRRHRPLRRHPGARDGQPVRSPPRPRLLPAHGRVRGAHVRRGQDPGRLHQARGARVRGGHPGRPPDRPPDPPALPRGLQGRHPARHHGPLDRPGERARRARHGRRVRPR